MYRLASKRANFRLIDSFWRLSFGVRYMGSDPTFQLKVGFDDAAERQMPGERMNAIDAENDDGISWTNGDFLWGCFWLLDEFWNFFSYPFNVIVWYFASWNSHGNCIKTRKKKSQSELSEVVERKSIFRSSLTRYRNFWPFNSNRQSHRDLSIGDRPTVWILARYQRSTAFNGTRSLAETNNFCWMLTASTLEKHQQPKLAANRTH